MQTIPNNTALLIFSRRSAAEVNVKDFFGKKGFRQNKLFTTKLIERTTLLAKNSGLPFYFIDETQQKGNTFGEKIVNAIDDVFNKGFQKVIIVGNDCLQLSKEKIQSAFSGLQTNTQVLMPTSNGGVSLIGIDKNCLNRSTFISIPWQTNAVFYTLIASHPQVSYVLPLADDINNFSDLQKNIRLLSKVSSLYAFIISLIASLQSFFSNLVSYTIFRERIFIGLRAPPVKG